MTFFMPAPGIIGNVAAGSAGPPFWPPVVRSFNQDLYANVSDITLPSDVQAGDLILVQITRQTAATHNSTAIPGFTVVGIANAVSDWRTNWTHAKIADGSESGQVLTVADTGSTTTYRYMAIAISMGTYGAVRNLVRSSQGIFADMAITGTLVANAPAFVLGHINSTTSNPTVKTTTVTLATSAHTPIKWWLGYKKTLSVSGSTLMGWGSPGGVSSHSICLMETDVS